MVNRCPCRTARRGCIMDRGRTRLPENGSAVDLARATPPGPGVTPQRFAPSADYLGWRLGSREACGTARRTHPRFPSAARIEIGSSPRAPQPPPPLRALRPLDPASRAALDSIATFIPIRSRHSACEPRRKFFDQPRDIFRLSSVGKDGLYFWIWGTARTNLNRSVMESTVSHVGHRRTRMICVISDARSSVTTVSNEGFPARRAIGEIAESTRDFLGEVRYSPYNIFFAGRSLASATLRRVRGRSAQRSA